MYNVRFAKDVVKFLRKSGKKFQAKVISSFEILSQNPFDSPLNVKTLINRRGHFRLRIGNCRFLYEVKDEVLLIYCYKAGSRGDVYKGL